MSESIESRGIVLLDSNIMIFDCMYNCTVKMFGREISLHSFDIRIPKVHNKMSEIRKNEEVTVTKTIIDEFGLALIRAVNDTAENFRYKLNYAARAYLKYRIQKRKIELLARYSSYNVPENPELFKEVTNFYIELVSKDDRLKKLKIKKSRRDILPERTDRILMCESIYFVGKRPSSSIFSDDGDFTEFASEIKNKFNVNIIGL